MIKLYENLEKIELNKVITRNKRINVVVSFKQNKYWVNLTDDFGEKLDGQDEITGEIEKTEIESLLNHLENVDFLEWATSELAHYPDPMPDMPFINYFMNDRDDPYTTYGDFLYIDKMHELYRLVNVITGKHMSFSKRDKEFYKIHDYKSIETVILSVYGESGTRYDVILDLQDRDYIIEPVDNDGNLVGERVFNSLKNIQISKYRNLLKELELLKWDILEDDPEVLGTEAHSVEFYIGDARFFTLGDLVDPEPLEKLLEQTEEILKVGFD